MFDSVLVRRMVVGAAVVDLLTWLLLRRLASGLKMADNLTMVLTYQNQVKVFVAKQARRCNRFDHKIVRNMVAIEGKLSKNRCIL